MFKRLKRGQFYGEVIRSRAFAGLSLTETRYPPGTSLPRHCHEHAYFCLVRQGTYREEYGSGQRSCGPFTLAFHPPEEVHAEHFDNAEVRSFNVEIMPSWLRGVAGTALLGRPFDSRGGPPVSLAMRLFDEFEYPDASSLLLV